LKSALAAPPALAALFAAASFLERRAPASPLLDRLYRLALGIHIQRGYRSGLKKHGVPACLASPAAATGAAPRSTAAEIGD
jgi:hypothetical protein